MVFSGYPPDSQYGQVSMYESDGSPAMSGPETTITVDYSDSEEHTFYDDKSDPNNKKKIQVG